MSVAAAQILALPAVKYAVERRHYLIAACGVAVFFFVARKWVRNGQNAPPRPPRSSKPPSQENPPTFDVASVVDSGEIADSVMEGVAVSLNAMIQEEENEQEKAIVEHLQQQPEDPLALAELARKEKAKRKKAKLKQTVIDGVGLVMGDSAGKLVESVIELSQQAKRSGVESFVKTGKLGKLFSKDIIPILKSKLQGKKFPTIVGSTDSPLGALQYEVSGITLDALEIDPSLQCDITDGQEALQLRLLISSAKLKNIAWKCGTAKIKEKGTADAEIVKAELLFRISIDKSQVIPKLSIKHCSIDIQQFNLQLGGGKASWMYNLLTSVFSNKIRTKLKEKIDKSLTKKCRQFETKINFAATKILSIFSDKKEKRLSDTVLLTPHKKCFLYANETMTEELECVLLDLRLFTEMVDLRTAFFGELGISHSTAHTRVRFRDKSGTLVTVSKSTTMAQIIEHAEHLCFYKETSQSLSSSSPGATSTLQLDASVSSSSLSSSFSSSSSSLFSPPVTRKNSGRFSEEYQ